MKKNRNKNTVKIRPFSSHHAENSNPKGNPQKMMNSSLDFCKIELFERSSARKPCKADPTKSEVNSGMLTKNLLVMKSTDARGPIGLQCDIKGGSKGGEGKENNGVMDPAHIYSLKRDKVSLRSIH